LTLVSHFSGKYAFKGAQMSETRLNSESKNKRVFTSSPNRLRQAQQLQREIDKLALLLYQAKKQSDKIQAVADAMGEAIFSNLDAHIASLAGRKKPATGNGKPSRLRSRTDKDFPVLAPSPELPQPRP
jgi:hypothetical protein